MAACPHHVIASSGRQVKWSLQWTVKNFTYVQKQLKSPIFSANFLEAYKWQMHICWEAAECLAVYLELICTIPPPPRISMELTNSILNEKGKCYFTKQMGRFIPTPGTCTTIQCNIKRESSEEASMDYWPEHCLTVVCDIIMNMSSSDYCELPNHNHNLGLESIESSLPKDFSRLLDDREYSDAVLDVKGTELRVHKAILTARSNVFAAMFHHEFEELHSNRIVINDMDKDVVQEMLRFMYTGQSPNLAKMLGELLAAADKYALEELKQMCVSQLAHSMTTDTAVQTLVLADRYHANQLKALAMDVIDAYDFVILETEDWRRLKNEYPLLCVEIYERQHKMQRKKATDGQ